MAEEEELLSKTLWDRGNCLYIAWKFTYYGILRHRNKIEGLQLSLSISIILIMEFDKVKIARERETKSKYSDIFFDLTSDKEKHVKKEYHCIVFLYIIIFIYYCEFLSQ